MRWGRLRQSLGLGAGASLDVGSDASRVGRGRGGFTFAEILAALAITTLLTSVITVGIQLAMREQRRSLYQSQSSALLSTLDNSLGELLRYASYNSADGTYTIAYRDDENTAISGTASDISIEVADATKTVEVYTTSGEVWENMELGQGQVYLTGPVKGATDSDQRSYFKLTNGGAYGSSAESGAASDTGQGMGGNYYAACEVTAASISFDADDPYLVTVKLTISPTRPLAGDEKDVPPFTYRINDYATSNKDLDTISVESPVEDNTEGSSTSDNTEGSS